MLDKRSERGLTDVAGLRQTTKICIIAMAVTVPLTRKAVVVNVR